MNLHKKQARIAALFAMAAALGCQGAGTDENVDDVGMIQLALQVAPADALCLRLTADSATTGLKVVKLIAIPGMGQATVTYVFNLPLGSVGLTGEAFGVDCPSVVATSAMTWVSDRQTVTLVPDFAPIVTLTLHRAAKVVLGIDFVSGAAVDEVKLPAIPGQIRAATLNAVYITPRSGNTIIRAKSAVDVTTLVASAPGPTKYLAVAADGSLLVTYGTNGLAVYKPGGNLLTTLTLPFTPGALALDRASNTAWIGSANTSQVLRIATATIAPSPVVISTPLTSTPALTLAADGSPRFGGAPGAILTFNPAGVQLSRVNVPLLPRALALDDQGAIWYVSQSAGTNVQRVLPDGTLGSGFVMPAPTDAAIISTPQGVLWALSTGGLELARPDGSFQFIPLPDNTVVNSLALASSEQVWAGDSARPRALMLKLP